MAIETRPRMLVVEDEFLVAMDLAGFLEQLGFEAVVAVRLDEALDTLSRFAGAFDAALLDINLAGARSWPVARALQSHGVRFAFLTGYEAEHADIPEDLRAAPVWPKPIELDRLRTHVQQSDLSSAMPKTVHHANGGKPVSADALQGRERCGTQRLWYVKV